MSSPFNVNMSQLGQVFQLFDSAKKGGNGDGRLSFAEAKAAADAAKDGTSLKALLTSITKDQATFDKFAASIDDEKKNYIKDANGNLITQNGKYVVDESQTSGFNASILDFQKYASNGFNITAGAFDNYPDLLSVKTDLSAAEITVSYNASTPLSELFKSDSSTSTTPSSTTPSSANFLTSFLPILFRLLFSQRPGFGSPIGGGYGSPTGTGGISPLTLLFLMLSQNKTNA